VRSASGNRRTPSSSRDRVPEPGAFEVIVRVMAAGSLQQRLGRPRQARLRHALRRHPSSVTTFGGSDASGSSGRSAPRHALEARDEVVVHCNQPHMRPEVHASIRWRPLRRRSGAMRRPGAPSRSSPRSRPSSCCTSPPRSTWESASYGLVLLHRLPDAAHTLPSPSRQEVLIWAPPAVSACSPPSSAPPPRQSWRRLLG